MYQNTDMSFKCVGRERWTCRAGGDSEQEGGESGQGGNAPFDGQIRVSERRAEARRSAEYLHHCSKRRLEEAPGGCNPRHLVDGGVANPELKLLGLRGRAHQHTTAQ